MPSSRRCWRRALFQRYAGAAEGDLGQRSSIRPQNSFPSCKTNLSLHSLALVLEQAHGQLVALEEYRVRVLDMGRERGAEVVKGRLRDDTSVALKSKRESYRHVRDAALGYHSRTMWHTPNQRRSAWTRPFGASSSPFWKAAASTILPSRSRTALPPVRSFFFRAPLAST